MPTVEWGYSSLGWRLRRLLRGLLLQRWGLSSVLQSDPVTYGTDAILVTQNAAGSVTPIPIETFAPSLQRSDGSYIGAGFGAFNTCSNGGMSEQSILAAVNVGGTDLTGGAASYPVWQQQIVPARHRIAIPMALRPQLHLCTHFPMAA